MVGSVMGSTGAGSSGTGAVSTGTGSIGVSVVFATTGSSGSLGVGTTGGSVVLTVPLIKSLMVPPPDKPAVPLVVLLVVGGIVRISSKTVTVMD